MSHTTCVTCGKFAREHSGMEMFCGVYATYQPSPVVSDADRERAREVSWLRQECDGLRARLDEADDEEDRLRAQVAALQRGAEAMARAALPEGTTP